MDHRYIYLFLALIGLVVLVLGGILVIGIVDAIRIAYTKHPSRFRRVDRLDAFQREYLPEIAETLGMEVIDEVPSQVQEAIEITVGRLGVGGVSDMLAKSYGGGHSACVIFRKISPGVTISEVTIVWNGPRSKNIPV